MYLSIDTETGGLTNEVSLLTVGLVLADANFNIIQKEHIRLIPDDKIYRVNPEGMAINKINLVELAAPGVLTYKEAGTYLYKLLVQWSNDGKTKLIPVGKQLAGDTNKIFQCLMTKATWENFVSYRQLDVSAVYMFMKYVCGYDLPEKGSLKDLADFFGITYDAHNALGDAEATLEVLKRLKQTCLASYLIRGT